MFSNNSDWHLSNLRDISINTKRIADSLETLIEILLRKE